ncbi:MAG TPA: DUF1538 domain-containing protein [Nitrospirae bacterium]|nr:DUF1538 domain-containing protein [Nitrospirota bacterium]
MKTVKYSEYLKEIKTDYKYISYNKLNSEHPLIDKKIKYSLKDALIILNPYIKKRWNEQFIVVVPIALYLALFQVIVIRQPINGWIDISLGLISVVIGLMLFMEGLKVGLMPFGETIGSYLPLKVSKRLVLLIAFLLGIGATFAEPAIAVLKEAGKIVSQQKSPLLFAMLTDYAYLTVIAVGLGVGVATTLGILMFIYSWSLKRLIYITLIPTLILTYYCSKDELLSSIIGLAWDCGAVTTGPVTVPLILSLGIGTASAIKHIHSSKVLPGFGIVTLASLIPITSVLILGIMLRLTISPSELTILPKETVIQTNLSNPFFDSIILSIQAIIPLVLFLLFIQKKIINEPIHNSQIILYGIILSLLGMSFFNLGLNYGLSNLGAQVGGLVPAAYLSLESVSNSPFFSEIIGLYVCFIFAFLLGYGATLAEPALNALGITVENLTNGAFRKKLVMISVSLGVAIGLMIGVIKIIFNIPIHTIVIPLYIIAIIFTIISEEKYVNLGWDSAGVTTGPITVPLVLAMGLSFAKASGSIDGFGILSMASVCPIISVLFVGLCVKRLEIKKAREVIE